MIAAALLPRLQSARCFCCYLPLLSFNSWSATHFGGRRAVAAAPAIDAITSVGVKGRAILRRRSASGQSCIGLLP